jgi:hypothetical protein
MLAYIAAPWILWVRPGCGEGAGSGARTQGPQAGAEQLERRCEAPVEFGHLQLKHVETMGFSGINIPYIGKNHWDCYTILEYIPYIQGGAPKIAI